MTPLPSIPPLPLPDKPPPLLARPTQQFKIPPMLKRARPITRQDQKGRRADERDEVQRQEQNKLADLSEGERRVVRRHRGLAQFLQGIGFLVMDVPT